MTFCLDRYSFDDRHTKNMQYEAILVLFYSYCMLLVCTYIKRVSLKEKCQDQFYYCNKGTDSSSLINMSVNRFLFLVSASKKEFMYCLSIKVKLHEATSNFFSSISFFRATRGRRRYCARGEKEFRKVSVQPKDKLPASPPPPHNCSELPHWWTK